MTRIEVEVRGHLVDRWKEMHRNVGACGTGNVAEGMDKEAG